MKSKITDSGLLEIPREMCDADEVFAGQECDIERVSRGEFRVRLIGPMPEDRRSLVEVLLECPVKDFFAPMERTQTTDDLKPMSFE